MRLFVFLTVLCLSAVATAKEKPVPLWDDPRPEGALEQILDQIDDLPVSRLIGGSIKTVSDSDIEEIAGSRGAKYLKHIIEASVIFKVPTDFLAVQIKQESYFSNLGYTDDFGNGSIGIGQVNVDEWRATAKEPEIIELGLESVFTRANFKLKKGGLHPRYNIMALAASLRRIYRELSAKSEAERDGFGTNLASWLLVGGAYNGGGSIWSTVYDYEGENNRTIDWANTSAAQLVTLIRTGHGSHAKFWKHSVANHIGMLSVFLFQSNVKFCKLNYKEKVIVKCGLTAEQKLAGLANYWANQAACAIQEEPVDENGNPIEGIQTKGNI